MQKLSAKCCSAKKTRSLAVILNANTCAAAGGGKRVYCRTYTLTHACNKDDGNLFYDATFCTRMSGGMGIPCASCAHLYAMKNV